MNYTQAGVQFLGADDTPPEKTAASNKEVAGAVSSVAGAIGDIASGFFGMKTEELRASRLSSNAAPSTSRGLDPKLKTTLIVGGSVAAAALILVVALK